MPDPENDGKPKRKVMYPLEIAQVYSYHPMVEYDDRDCYPNCPGDNSLFSSDLMIHAFAFEIAMVIFASKWQVTQN